jgi:hypothetical protein
LKFVKYILIIILSIGLYFTWFHKQKTISQLKNKIEKLKIQLQKTKLKYQILKKDYPKEKVIKLILPNTKKNYSTIPINQDLNINKLDLKSTQQKNNDMQIVPSVELDKHHKVQKVQIELKTKF